MPETHNPGSIRRRCNARSRWARCIQEQHQASNTPLAAQAVPPPAKPKAKPAPAPDLFNDSPMPERTSIPFQQIVAAYHKHMVAAGCPRVRTLSESTRGSVRVRWNEDKERQSLEWWDQYFEYAAGCPWLVGQGGAERPFYADFTWLVGPKNMEKVINGRYAHG